TPIGQDCRAIDFTGTQAPAIYRANRLLERCTDGLLAPLDSCATALATEKVCVQGSAEQSADFLFTAIYRPDELLGTPTPTPTGTPPPPTPSASPTGTTVVSATPTTTRTRTATSTSVPTATPS